MAIQVQGVDGTIAAVEAATRAMRTALRPIDIGTAGSFRKTVSSGIMAAGLAANSPILAVRWTSTSLLAVVRRVQFHMWSLGTAFAAGLATFDLFQARGFTVADTGGGVATLTTNNGKLRTSHGTTAMGEIRLSATATLTAGTRTKDADPLARLSAAISNVANTVFVPFNTDLFRAPQGEMPAVLAANEGLVIEATVPATGTWTWTAAVEWDEVATYAP